MKTVNVATLKEKLSYYLGLVRDGNEVVVTSHRHEVARILPPSGVDARISEPVRPVKDLKHVKGINARRSPSAVKLLTEDRRRR